MPKPPPKPPLSQYIPAEQIAQPAAQDIGAKAFWTAMRPPTREKDLAAILAQAGFPDAAIAIALQSLAYHFFVYATSPRPLRARKYTRS